MSKNIKLHIIIKIGEDLVYTENHKKLSTGEPIKFGSQLIEASSEVEDTIVLLYSTDTNSKSLYTFGKNNKLISTFSDQFIIESIIYEYLNNKNNSLQINTYLWQGISLKFINDDTIDAKYELDVENISKHYKMFNEIDKYCKTYNVENNKYFVQTDLRLPLFSLRQFSDTSEIDTSDVTLLSQAKLSYNTHEEIENIYDNHCIDFIKELNLPYYNKFKNFKHLPMEFIPYKNDIKSIYNKPVEYDSTFLSQGYSSFSKERKKIFEKILCNSTLNSTHRISVFGRHTRRSHTQLLENLNKYRNKFLLPSMHSRVNWSDLVEKLNRSLTTININNEAYEKYELTPNRYIESICAYSIPLLFNLKHIEKRTQFYEELECENFLDVDRKIKFYHKNKEARELILEMLNEEILEEYNNYLKKLNTL